MNLQQDLTFIHEPSWDVIKRRNKEGTTIIVTSHYLEDIENLARRIIKIEKGRINIDDLLSNINSTARRKIVTLKAGNINTFINLPSVELYEVKDDKVILKTTNLEVLMKEIVMTKVHFEDLRVYDENLDHYFMAGSQGTDKVSQ